MQDVDEVFNHQHVPQTDDGKTLFREKQKLMHSAFTSTLLTNRGKKHAREHELDFNAQSVYEKLANFYTDSTVSRVNECDLLSYMTSAKLDSWKGASESFMMHWQDQTRLHESLVETQSYFSENQKKTLLENAASPSQSLRAIKDQANQLQTHNRTPLRCDQYSDLLLSAANIYDNQFTSKSSKTSRRICDTKSQADNSHSHDDSHHDAACEVTEDAECDVDAPTSTLLANLNKMNAASYLPSEDCRLLSPEAKELWGKMQNDMKSIVLKCRNNDARHNNNYDKSSFNNNEPKSNQFRTVKPPNYVNNSFTKANLHQLFQSCS